MSEIPYHITFKGTHPVLEGTAVIWADSLEESIKLAKQHLPIEHIRSVKSGGS